MKTLLSTGMGANLIALAMADPSFARMMRNQQRRLERANAPLSESDKEALSAAQAKRERKAAAKAARK